MLVNCLPSRRSCCLQCGTLRDMVSVTVWRLHGRSNACECMLPFFLPSYHFYLFALVSMAFERVYQLSNACMPFQRVNTSNLMTFDFFVFLQETKIYCQDKNLIMSPIKTNINGMLHQANPSAVKFPLI